MDEIFYDVTSELRGKVFAGIKDIFQKVEENHYSPSVCAKMLSDFTSSFEDEYERRYCEFTIRVLIEGEIDNE